MSTKLVPILEKLSCNCNDSLLAPVMSVWFKLSFNFPENSSSSGQHDLAKGIFSGCDRLASVHDIILKTFKVFILICFDCLNICASVPDWSSAYFILISYCIPTRLFQAICLFSAKIFWKQSHSVTCFVLQLTH